MVRRKVIKSLNYKPPPLDQQASDTLDNAVQKPVTYQVPATRTFCAEILISTQLFVSLPELFTTYELFVGQQFRIIVRSC
jgi:hypothetical protein